MKIRFSIIILLFSIGTLFAQEEWNLEKTDDSIHAYSRIKSGTQLKEVKIISTIDRPIDIVVDALMDFDNYSAWQGGLKTIELIEKISESETIIYYEVALPWPMTDRNFIIRTIRDYESRDKCRLSMDAENSITYDSDEEHIRMTDLSGFWFIESLSESKSQLTYEFFSDPNGDVPEFLVNAFAIDTPLKNIKKLKNYLEK